MYLSVPWRIGYVHPKLNIMEKIVIVIFYSRVNALKILTGLYDQPYELLKADVLKG